MPFRDGRYGIMARLPPIDRTEPAMPTTLISPRPASAVFPQTEA
ncbi:hypothetical protein [Frateuria sp. STR12]|nr:hypothetical protein [Frateuria sp. STR12]MCX7513491.1 hypothetical protein [Frateuria sp. STR12]